MITQFRTIADRSEGFYKEKGSKFIGIALPVADLDAVKHALDEIRLPRAHSNSNSFVCQDVYRAVRSDKTRLAHPS
ncbi:MAG: hypothetical protein AAGA02_06605, partial [Bacteroidota bacterium]